jgi:methylmalonyl-CoA mutase C-terminal domain/subunit
LSDPTEPTGRPVKVLLGLLGMDQHEVGALHVASALRDGGMEVVYVGRFNLPAHIVEAAVQEGVDVIGLSCHSWEYLHYLDELMAELRARGLSAPVVLGGSVVTAADADSARKKGVAASFGPAADPDDIVATIRRLGTSPDPEAP